MDDSESEICVTAKTKPLIMELIIKKSRKKIGSFQPFIGHEGLLGE